MGNQPMILGVADDTPKLRAIGSETLCKHRRQYYRVLPYLFRLFLLDFMGLEISSWNCKRTWYDMRGLLTFIKDNLNNVCS